MAKHFLTLVIPIGAVLAFLGQGGCEALDDRPKTVGDFCGEYARRECEPTAVTCSRNRAECEPRRREVCEAFVAPLASASRVFRRENAEACLAQVTETYKKNVITATDLDALADKCDRVVEGPGMSNATCDADQDCRSPLVCDKNRCGPLRMVAAGGNCANPGEVCPTTEYCRSDSGLAVCTGRPDKGAACSDSLPCRPTLRCDGTCQDKLAANSPCQKDDDCTTDYCNPHPPASAGPTCLPGLIFAPFAPTCDAYFGPSSSSGPDGGAVRRIVPVADGS